MPTSLGGASSRRGMSLTSSSSMGRRKSAGEGAGGGGVRDSPSYRKSLTSSRSMGSMKGEQTVKRLRLLKALTIPDSTSVKEACRRMAARRVDAVLLTDSNALLCGILTDKDIPTRVIAREINPEETPVSKVMTRNPIFVLSDALAVEALQKMVQGKFRHLPVVENGEVIALLDITKCLYDIITRLERAAEKGKAIVAAVEGVEKQWGSSVSGPSTFIETLREKIFGPSLSTIISENSMVVAVDPSETVLSTAKKILEHRTNCAVVTVENKPRGIITSKDMLMRVIAQNLPPESTPVEKVMTPNPECARIDSPIVDALHTMHDGRFLHLPIVDKDGLLVTVLDVLEITNAVLSKVGISAGVSSETANTMMQNIWDSAMALSPDERDETLSVGSTKAPSEGGDIPHSLLFPSSTLFAFKIEDRKGRLHRFICDSQSLTDLVSAVFQRIGVDVDYKNLPQILYEDEDHDKVVLASDGDLQAAVYHAKLAGWKGLKLHLEYPGSHDSHNRRHRRTSSAGQLTYHWKERSAASAYSAVAAGAALIAAFGVYAFMKRAGK